MSTYSDEIKSTFDRMESHELLDRLQGSSLTPEAEIVARHVLSSRGVDPKDSRTFSALQTDSDNLDQKQPYKPSIWTMLFIAMIIGRGIYELFKRAGFHFL